MNRPTKEERLADLAQRQAEAERTSPNKLIEELRHYQIELEVQNEQLNEAQRALELSHLRYTDLYHQAPIAYFTLTLTGVIEEVNQRAAELLGVAPPLLVGIPLIVAARVSDKRAFLAHLTQCVVVGEKVATELALELKSGPINVLMKSVPIRAPSGAVTGCRTMMSDITRIKVAEDRARAAYAEASAAHAREAFLSATSARLAALIPNVTVEAIAQLTVPWFAETCAVEITSRKHSLGVASAGAVKLELPATVPVLPQHLRAERFDDLAVALAAAEHDPVRRGLLEAVMPESLIMVPLNSGGQLLGRMLLCTNARSYVDGDLALAEELARRVSIAVEHSLLYEDLQRALRIRDDLLSMISHDLKQTLHALRIQLHLVEDDTSKPLTNARHYLDVMLRFVDGVLDLGQIEADTLTIRADVEDVHQIVKEAIQLAQPEARPPIVAIIDEGLKVVCDRGRLLQVLFNLLNNAAKFAPEAGEIRVNAGPNGDWVEFAIADAGPGIAPEDLPHVFERYWRAHPDRFPGFGLGLYIIKKIVQAHGGKIWLESKLDHGSTFHFQLPRG
jgi:PAS domain S-box-containing protein